MKLCKLDLNNQTLVIIITSIVWAMNFRCTFNNINVHMDIGSYYTLKFDPFLLLIKNIMCMFFFLGFLIEMKIINIFCKKKQSDNNSDLNSIKSTKSNIYYIPNGNGNDENSEFIIFNHSDSSGEKFCFILKVFLLIVFIYISEESYFILANNHILDRIICPIRNMFALFVILIPILFRNKISKTIIKNFFIYQKHYIFPLIIIFLLSLFLMLYNYILIPRFVHIFNTNICYYIICFVLMGFELTTIKYLVDKLFINKFLILAIKGLLGTITFTIICIETNEKNIYDFFDKFLSFEYLLEPEEYSIIQKIAYIVTLCILQYLKIIVINLFGEAHLLSAIMITDILYFPLYCIERFEIQDFGISTLVSFYANIIIGFLNTFMMLIFNEILELNFCGLNKYLRKNIINREKAETDNIIDFNNRDNDTDDNDNDNANSNEFSSDNE